MSISTDEAKRARAKRKRAARKAARKVKVAEAKARDARIKASHRITSAEDKQARLNAFLKGLPAPKRERLPEDQPWTWDSRIKPPEVSQ